MTAKEKAKELLWKYLPILEGWTDDAKTDLAKKCALIAVDEIIKSEETVYGEGEVQGYFFIEYWDNVKFELKNL